LTQGNVADELVVFEGSQTLPLFLVYTTEFVPAFIGAEIQGEKVDESEKDLESQMFDPPEELAPSQADEEKEELKKPIASLENQMESLFVEIEDLKSRNRDWSFCGSPTKYFVCSYLLLLLLLFLQTNFPFRRGQGPGLS